MPTFKQLIFKHQQKEDGSFNVKIRITHNRKSKYVSTSFYIKDKQVTAKYGIKDRSIIKKVEEEIDSYWDIIKKLPDIQNLDVSDLVDLLEKEKTKLKAPEIDFIAFSKKHISQLESNGGGKYAASFKTTINSLGDFFGRESVLIAEINANMLVSYEVYLRKDRVITRLNQFGKPVQTKQKGMGNGALTYLTNIRTLFNAALFEYNDEDNGVINIKHYPFRKYKLDKKKLPEKRSLKPTTIKQLLDFHEEKPSRATLGRDVFLISFYLLGTNLIDLYEVSKIENGRLVYNRIKTADRRADSAFISIKVEKELQPLIDKYRDKKGKRVFRFYEMYTSSENFVKAVNIGLAQVAKMLELDVIPTTYCARHSWATIARNNCKVSKDDVAMALNHVDTKHKVTDAYLNTDWSVIDNANTEVLSLFRRKLTPEEIDNKIVEFFENNPMVYDNLEDHLI